MDKEKKWKVYLHVSKIDGRIYCGITSQKIQQRWHYGNGYKGCSYFERAINKYGWDNFHHIVLMRNGTKDDALLLEKAIVLMCNLQNPNYGFNICDGGTAGSEISEEGKKRLHDTFYRSASPNARKVVLFDYSTGNKLMTFDCMSECADFLNIKLSSLSRYLKPDSNAFRQKYFIRYADDVQDINTLLNIDELKEKYKYIGRSLKINQYSLDGKYIRTFRSIVEASEETSASRPEISSCAIANPKGNNSKKSAGGFMWRFYTGDTSDIEPIFKERNVPVKQVNIETGDTISVYRTIADAAKANGIKRCVISNAVNSKSHYGKGFLWFRTKLSSIDPGVE